MITAPDLPPGTIAVSYLLSPLGHLLVMAGPQGLTRLLHHPILEQHSAAIPDHWHHILAAQPGNNMTGSATRQLTEYFQKKRKRFDLPLDLSAGTSFQQHVWTALQSIPYSTTLTYGKLATRLGDPKKSRAVGAANGANPLPIIIPCHRVIGAGGQLTGFALGVNCKQWLLLHEGYNSNQYSQLSLPL